MFRGHKAAALVAFSAAALTLTFLPNLSPAYAATYTASGDSNGYCSQSITLGTGTAVSVSLTGSTCVVTFTGTGTYTWSRPKYINRFRVLVIGGGGGGGGDYGGGGGAGGFIDTTTTISYATTSTTVTVGAGGAGNAGGGTITAGAAPLTKAKTPDLYELNAGLDRDKDGVACEN